MKLRYLVLFLFCSILQAGVYTIRLNEETREDYFYTLPHILDNIPELDIRPFDATDQNISRLGNSSMRDNSVLLLVNGTRETALQDGRLVGDLRSVGNNVVDSIVVYTGVHAENRSGNYSVIVDLISKKHTNNSIGAIAYMGSEVGDPTALLEVMDPSLIPYNKEQLAAGEVFGSLSTGKFGHYGGLNLIYMDRYSNRLENERSERYPTINSSLHMQEVRKGNYSLQFHGRENRAGLDLSLVDYNLFRYDHVNMNYNYYEGTRGKVSLSDQFDSDQFWGSINLGLLYEKAKIFESELDSISGDWSDLSLWSEFGYKGNQRYSISFEANGEHGERPIIHTDSVSVLPLNDNFKISGTVVSFDGVLRSTVSYPPSLSLISHFLVKEKSKFSAAISFSEVNDYLDNSRLEILSELTWDKDINLMFMGAKAGVEYGPLVEQQQNGLLFEPYETSLWGEVHYGISKYLNFSLYGSNYLLSSSIQSEYTVQGLTIAGGIYYKSKTLWDSETHLQRSFLTHSTTATETLPNQFTGSFSLSYALFKDRLKMAIAIRDIGKARVAILHGCYVGPVMVSNFHLKF
jgi:hypothetical protein